MEVLDGAFNFHLEMQRVTVITFVFSFISIISPKRFDPCGSFEAFSDPAEFILLKAYQMENYILTRSLNNRIFRITFLTMGLLGLVFQTLGQEKENIVLKKNSAYFELAGNAGLYSMNLDRIFYQHNDLRSCLRIGLTSYNYKTWYLPIELFLMLGEKNHYFEFGGGITPSWGTRKYLGANPSRYIYYYYDHYFALRCGYRYQKQNGGFMFRAGLTPLFFTEKERPIFEKSMILFWPSLCAGWSF